MAHSLELTQVQFMSIVSFVALSDAYSWQTFSHILDIVN